MLALNFVKYDFVVSPLYVAINLDLFVHISSMWIILINMKLIDILFIS